LEGVIRFGSNCEYLVLIGDHVEEVRSVDPDVARRGAGKDDLARGNPGVGISAARGIIAGGCRQAGGVMQHPFIVRR